MPTNQPPHPDAPDPAPSQLPDPVAEMSWDDLAAEVRYHREKASIQATVEDVEAVNDVTVKLVLSIEPRTHGKFGSLLYERIRLGRI